MRRTPIARCARKRAREARLSEAATAATCIAAAGAPGKQEFWSAAMMATRRRAPPRRRGPVDGMRTSTPGSLRHQVPRPRQSLLGAGGRPTSTATAHSWSVRSGQTPSTTASKPILPAASHRRTKSRGTGFSPVEPAPMQESRKRKEKESVDLGGALVSSGCSPDE